MERFCDAVKYSTKCSKKVFVHKLHLSIHVIQVCVSL